VTKRWIDIDEDLLEKAKVALGAATVDEAVDLALRWVVSSARGISKVDWDRFADATQDLSDPEVMRGAWE
jgi:Arc/MetJ family transcription regulator